MGSHFFLQVNDITFDGVIEKLREDAKSMKEKLYLYKEKEGYFISSEYHHTYIAYAYPGGRIVKTLSAKEDER